MNERFLLSRQIGIVWFEQKSGKMCALKAYVPSYQWAWERKLSSCKLNEREHFGGWRDKVHVFLISIWLNWKREQDRLRFKRKRNLVELEFKITKGTNSLSYLLHKSSHSALHLEWEVPCSLDRFIRRERERERNGTEPDSCTLTQKNGESYEMGIYN